jgi:hypothetical protein
MRFSDHFKLKRTRSDTWFDPVLSIDTQLFIDPFLLYDHAGGLFRGSHAEVIRFFNSVFRFVAQARGDPTAARYKKAADDLLFPEVQELCLGYTAAGTRGSGSGRDLAKIIAAALWYLQLDCLTVIGAFSAELFGATPLQIFRTNGARQFGS